MGTRHSDLALGASDERPRGTGNDGVAPPAAGFTKRDRRRPAGLQLRLNSTRTTLDCLSPSSRRFGSGQSWSRSARMACRSWASETRHTTSAWSGRTKYNQPTGKSATLRSRDQGMSHDSPPGGDTDFADHSRRTHPPTTVVIGCSGGGLAHRDRSTGREHAGCQVRRDDGPRNSTQGVSSSPGTPSNSRSAVTSANPVWVALAAIHKSLACTGSARGWPRRRHA